MANYRARPLPPALQGLPQNVVGNMLHGWFVSHASKNILVYKTEKPDGAGPRHSHLTTFWIDLNFTGGTKVGGVRIGATAHGKSGEHAYVQASFEKPYAMQAYELLTRALRELAVVPEQTSVSTSELIPPRPTRPCPKPEPIVLETDVVEVYIDPNNNRNWFWHTKLEISLGYVDEDVNRYNDPTSGVDWFDIPRHNFMVWASNVKGWA